MQRAAFLYYRRLIYIASAIGVGVCAPSGGRAESLGRVEVRAASPTVEVAPGSDAATVTRISVGESVAGAVSVADVLEGEAGIRVRSRGGQGAFSSVSIRGSEAAEVAVLLDGVPLSRAGFGLVDLSQIPLEGLSRIEIYRGVAPAELGGEAIGGVINLVSKTGSARRRIAGSAGAGSFGARLVAASFEQPFGRWRSQLSLGYRGANGDFSYFDNGGTLYLRSDDGTRTRRNNGFDQVTLHLGLRRSGVWAYTLIVDGFWRKQGVPGFATLGVETQKARLDSAHLYASLRETGPIGGGVRLNVVENLAVERLAFSNPLGELVGPFGASVVDALVLVGGVQASLDRRFGKHQLGRAIVELRGEGRFPTNLLAPTTRSGDPAGRLQWALALVDEAFVLGDRLRLEGTLRLDGNLSGAGGATTHRFFASPRLGIRGRVAEHVWLRGSAGRFVRMPTLLELFGDGGFFLGAPALRPESAWGGEAGVHVEGERAIAKGALDAAFFARDVTDLITYVPGQNASTATNVGRARFLGVEARGDLQLWHALSLSLRYTFLDPRNLGGDSARRDKLLPARAPHELDLRVALAGHGLELGYDVHYVSDVFRDELNLNRLPSYVLHALDVRMSYGPVAVAVELHNLADLRQVALPLGGSARAGQTTPYPLVDFFNYPLPGRAVYATVSLHD